MAFSPYYRTGMKCFVYEHQTHKNPLNPNIHYQKQSRKKKKTTVREGNQRRKKIKSRAT